VLGLGTLQPFLRVSRLVPPPPYRVPDEHDGDEHEQGGEPAWLRSARTVMKLGWLSATTPSSTTQNTAIG
jgi:hypothetical protein